MTDFSNAVRGADIKKKESQDNTPNRGVYGGKGLNTGAPVQNKTNPDKHKIKTQGRKGEKLPRVSLFLSEEIHRWVESEAPKRGEQMVDLINEALNWYMYSPAGHSTEIKVSEAERTWHANFGLQPEIYRWVKPEARYRRVVLSAFIDSVLREYMNSPMGTKVVADWLV